MMEENSMAGHTPWTPEAGIASNSYHHGELLNVDKTADIMAEEIISVIRIMCLHRALVICLQMGMSYDGLRLTEILLTRRNMAHRLCTIYSQ